jgi:fructoselysine 6-kinase
MSRLLGIGDSTVDIYLSEGMQYPGGNTVNVAVQARRCGMAASWLGCLGRDMLGDLVWNSLRAEDVDVSHVRRIDGPNPWSRIRHAGNDRQFVGSNPGVRSRYGLTEADARFIAQHDVVHTSVHSDLDREAAWLKQNAHMLAYDYSEHWERPGVAATLAHVDVAFFSAARRSDAECAALLHWFAGQGPSIVVATRGAAGAVALSGAEIASAPAAPATVVDTLGAGDGLIAGFLVALAEGCPLGQCLSRGAEQAARVCTHKGGFGHGAPIVPGQPGLDPGQVVRFAPAVPAAPRTGGGQQGEDIER